MNIRISTSNRANQFSFSPNRYEKTPMGVGMARRPPLPPNRTCGFPASGSPVGASRLILQVAGLARLAVAKAFKEISPSFKK
jgi:hypothetical protein